MIARSKSKSVTKIHKSIPITSLNPSLFTNLEQTTEEIRYQNKERESLKSQNKSNAETQKRRRVVNHNSSIDRLPIINSYIDLCNSVAVSDSK